MENRACYGCLPAKIDFRDYRLCSSKVDIQYPDEFSIDNLPRIKDQGQVNSCHDATTQVLTRNGWKYFNEISTETLLASVNPDTGDLIFEQPSNIIKEFYTGNMITCENNVTNFMVTPNHKMVVRKWNNALKKLEDSYQFIDADKLGCYSGLCTSFYQRKDTDKFMIFPEEKISNGNIIPQLTISMSTWVKFIGIYLAEGTLLKNDKSKHYGIQIACVKTRERQFVKDLLAELQIQCGETYKDRYIFYKKQVWKKLEDYGLFRIKSYDKFVPDFIFDLDTSYIKDFLLGFAMGDGSCLPNGRIYYCTSSNRLAEQLQILLLMSGTYNTITHKSTNILNQIRVRLKDGREIKAKHDMNWVCSSIGTRSVQRKKYIFNTYYSGYVYCAEVPTYHTLVTRRQGKILLSGNCCAHATSSILEYHANNNYQLSTNFIYGIQRKLFNQNQIGMYLRDALEITRLYGDMLEHDCLGNDEIPVCYSIAEKAFNDHSKKKKANVFRIDSYYLCTTDNDIKYALMNYGPVLCAIDWKNKFIVQNDTVFFDPTSQGGGHAVVCIGWNKQGWLVQNSWGKGFANGGRFILPFEVGFIEARAIIDKENDDELNDLVLTKPVNNRVLDFCYKICNFVANLFKTIFTY